MNLNLQHDWRWHDRVPMWEVCRYCFATRRRAEKIGEHLYRLDGETQWQTEEPECQLNPTAEMAQAGAPSLFDLEPEQ